MPTIAPNAYDTATAKAYPPFVLADVQLNCAPETADSWYPKPGGSVVEAVAACRRCPVRVECLDWALETRQAWGVWGASTPNQRKRILRKRGPQ